MLVLSRKARESIVIGGSTEITVLEILSGAVRLRLSALDVADGRIITVRFNEEVHIGDNITVKVVDIRCSTVRLGTEAPIEIPVHRREIFDAIQREGPQAARFRRRVGNP